MKNHSKISRIIISSFLLLSLISCEKENKKNNDETICNITSMSISYEEEYEGELYASVETLVFSYDSDGKLTKWQLDQDEYMQFTYGSNGKLEKIQEFYDNEASDYILFTWDNNTVTRQWYWKDGTYITPSSSKHIIHFNDNDEIIKVEGFNLDYNNEWINEWYDAYTWENGNLIKVEEYALYLNKNNGKRLRKTKPIFPSLKYKGQNQDERNQIESLKIQTNDFVKEYTYDLTYDTKKNPFSHHHALGLYEANWVFLPKNNVLTLIATDHWTDEEWSIGTISYQYNSFSYPTSLLIERQEENFSSTESWEMSYSCI